MSEVLTEVRAIQSAAGWTELVRGSLRATVVEVLGERLPALAFTDVDGRAQVMPRSAVTSFDGDLVEPADPAADWRRDREARLNAGFAVKQVRGGVVVFRDPQRLSRDNRAALEEALAAAIDDHGVIKKFAQQAWSLLVDRVEIDEFGEQPPGESAVDFLNRFRRHTTAAIRNTAETVIDQLCEYQTVELMADLLRRRPARKPATR